MSSPEQLQQELALLQRRLEREREARKSAEQLLTEKSRELYGINQALQQAVGDMTDAQRRLRLALWGSSEMIWEWEASSDTMWLHYFTPDGNETIETVLWFDLLPRIHPDDVVNVMLAWNAHLFGHSEHYVAEYRAQSAEGWCWVRTRGTAIERDSNGLALRVSGSRKDVTQQRESEAHLRLLAAAFANTRDAILVLTPDQRVLQANQACTDLFGVDLHQIGGLRLADLLSDAAGTFPWQAVLSQKSWYGELSGHHRKGHHVPLEISSTQVFDRRGQLSHIVLSLRDISERQRAAENVERLSRFDSLTQLPNRQQFSERLQQHVQQLQANEHLAVLFLDLDSFKEINDALGHNAGDQLLQLVADRLQKTLRKRDLIARWGGDEFVVLLEPAQSNEECLVVADKMLAALNEPFLLSNQPVTITTSIGVTLAPEQGIDASQLLRQADAAMYAAKRDGRNRYARYRPEMNENLLHRVKLSNLLRRAVDNGEFTLALQPKIRLATRGITGAEALLRWEPEEIGRVPPATFIPLAEELGLIVPIGHWLIREAAGLLAQWQRAGKAINLAINLSGRQLRDELLFDVLQEAIRLCDAPARLLELEVTESILLEDVGFARTRLQRLRDAGFSIALDDFGTGYSSLSYLKELPLDRIKIDRSFISDLDMSPRGRALLSSIVTLCRALLLEITAEGVETEAQLDLVQAEGIDEVQGYYFYRPMAIADFTRLLQQAPKSDSAP